MQDDSCEQLSYSGDVLHKFFQEGWK